MASLFPHLDLPYEAYELRRYLAAGAGVAFHADADGFFAAYLASLVAEEQSGPMYQVFTENLDLVDLDAWVRGNSLNCLATFDINVLSAPSALGRLATSLPLGLRVYDDHKGLSAILPDNVETIELLPSGSDSLPEIRPASLFCFELARQSALSNPRRQLVEFVALAAAHGEGVARPFAKMLPRLPNSLNSLARAVGRGVNAYYTDSSLQGDDMALMMRMRDLSESWVDKVEAHRDLRDHVLGSDIFAMLTEAENIVSSLVEGIARQAAVEDPWFHTKEFPVYLVRVDAPRRIVHLAASATRTKVDQGVVVSCQDTRAGVGFELRRARALHSPDLADLLLTMDSSWFLSRGGHPMAAGATVKRGAEEAVLEGIERLLKK
ncbi:DHH family phosphoesterase [Streptomyces dubilierae]|uniref:DHHA1 domain-containing protein n=1 Tax=Streptomyces dubilierae TaxID=3075533 RepID=A0ABU2PG43_9ACTN|nr:hypothetical protein [Streptomyces sp. DSM 41921]MDT0390619.1 hypothetical protein [Streptomyces sp. DSM 41921]